MTNLQSALKPFANALERSTIRPCRRCSSPFTATGFVTLCEVCESLPPEPKAVLVRELGESWPERHRAKLAAMQGPGLAKAQSLLPMALDGSGSMLVLTGDRGRGKSQIATWLAWQRGRKGQKPGIYAKAFDLFSDVKATWAKGAAESETKIMDRYKSAPFLALDECHERSESDWENRTLRNVLDHRYDACLPTVILGNWLQLDDISASLGASITDRITETGGVVWCKWESYRAS